VVKQLQARRDALQNALDDLATLEEAENELASISAALSEVENALDQVPAEHQIPENDAREALDAADEALSAAQAQRDGTRDQHEQLKGAHRARRQLAKKLASARRDARVAKRLAALLGKSELQGRLLTDATNGVEAYANDALARISGGTLELELRRDDGGGDANLDIFVRDRSSAEEPLEVAFISGSQKFRVAVALAAGLGQYLGGTAAIRSLVIDEGFGSLDSEGRQRMIEELRALSEHLDRIIVVSHQDDFTDRTLFPHGFLLTKEGTRTLVERVG
jgi:DNA repair exonuclease SbcCD ATPase subunit